MKSSRVFTRRRFLSSCFALPAFASSPAFAISSTSTRRIPALCYHSWLQYGYSYETNALIALAYDLETLYALGWTVIPALWVAEWIAGERDESTFPEKAIVITFDDGAAWDWYNYNSVYGNVQSAYTVLADFKARHPDLPVYSPHATSFVIASPIARGLIGIGPRDEWWWQAQNASYGLMSIQNHSTDHDHPSIDSCVFDSDLNTYMRIGSIIDESWERATADFTRINTESTANAEVNNSAKYIASVTGTWPTHFAYPLGQASDYMENEYFPNNPGNGMTYAAFGTGGRAAAQTDKRYNIPRIIYGWHWRTPEEFVSYVLGESLENPSYQIIKKIFRASCR